MLPTSVEFIELIEANPFTPVEILFEDFFGKDKNKNRTVKSILDELDVESRGQIVRILNIAGYEDII